MSKYLREKQNIDKTLDGALNDVDWQDVDGSIGLVELCNGRDTDDKEYWAYICLYPSKYREYKDKAATGQPLEILQYGKALLTGWGEHPPEDIKRQMEEKYGLSHDTFLEDDVNKHLQDALKGA